MAEEERSFTQLVGEAPLAKNEDTITLVGALERSQEQGKFVLVMGAGRSVTLDIDSVKKYRVLGGVVGQLVVEVDIARDRLPHDPPAKSPLLDYPYKVPYFDAPLKNPAIDNFKYIIETTGTLQETIGYPYFGGLPWQLGGVYAGPAAAGSAAPFALATPHHATQGVIAGMQAGAGGPNVFGTSPLVDNPKVPTFDGVFTAPSPASPNGDWSKAPIADIKNVVVDNPPPPPSPATNWRADNPATTWPYGNPLD